jgi:rSAM/selenodomain-associated transferase 2
MKDACKMKSLGLCRGKRTPHFSVIIPVLNESEGINEVISSLRALEPDDGMELIVVDGDPSGSTINGVTSSCVRKVISDRGRARQMNRGAEVAEGEILVFLHADTRLPEAAFPLINQALSDRSLVAGAFDLGFETYKRIFKITEKYVQLRTRLTKVPFGDQAIFIRRRYFEKIGGYRDIPIMEDVDLMKRIKRNGNRIAVIPEKVLTSPRRYETEGIVRCTLRNWVLQILFSLGVQPERLEKWYKS